MTLNKVVGELISELSSPNLTKEEVECLKKYQGWLLGIKATVSNNTKEKNESVWYPFPKDRPIKPGYYLAIIEYQPIRAVYWRGDEWAFTPKVLAWSELLESREVNK